MSKTREASSHPLSAVGTNSRRDAVLPLLKEASESLSKGDFLRANAVLERALRIDPHDAEIWHQFALLRLAEGDAEQAEAMISKSDALSADNHEIQRRNAEVLAGKAAWGPGRFRDAKRAVIKRDEQPKVKVAKEWKPTPRALAGGEPQVPQEEHEMSKAHTVTIPSLLAELFSAFGETNLGGKEGHDWSKRRATTYLYGPAMRSRVFRKRSIPPGHLPPPGKCRVWYSSRPPGHQPPPGDCQVLRQRIAEGARLIFSITRRFRLD